MGKTTFADILRGLRRKAGLSQPRLAERAGVSVGSVRNLEQGIREPSYSTLVRLAAALGASLGDFGGPAPAESLLPPAPPEGTSRKRPSRSGRGKGKGRG